MIGDWMLSLINRYDRIEKKFCKVTGIRTDTEFPLIQCDDTDVWYHIESYEPIPLIPEILEKNGFVKEGYDGWKYYEYEGDVCTKNILCMILWRVDMSMSHLRIRSFSDKYASFSKFNINYVHELQHTLRLCGINKEIVL